MTKERRRPITQHDKESGARVREMRILDFGDQNALAEFLGISQPYVSLIEKGERRLMPDDRFKLTKEKKWNMRYIDFGKGQKHLNKDYFKSTLVNDIGDFKIELDILRVEFERLKEDYAILLRMFQDSKK